MARPTTRSALGVLTRARLLELAAESGLGLPKSLAKAEAIVGFDELIDGLKRDELKEICRAHDLDDNDRKEPPSLLFPGCERRLPPSRH